jgi:multimeric flavodoxin WrbA
MACAEVAKAKAKPATAINLSIGCPPFECGPRKARNEFADPNYDLSIDWLTARGAIADAQRRHAERSKPAILLINCSSRSEHTCPGEMSKSYRLLEIAREVFAAAPGVAIELLDLSRLASEYGRHIHPCKACFSTAPALCHWPCSCYPNYSLGQTQDWMNEIYPMCVAAHGIMIITPVNWYQVSSPLKLMMDRLVCADGGNPDPTRTQGKNAELAKRIELEGWDYPRHLEGRLWTPFPPIRRPRSHHRGQPQTHYFRTVR